MRVKQSPLSVGKSAVLAMVILLLVGCGGLSLPSTSDTVAIPAEAKEAANRAGGWLAETHQNADGGYADFSTGAGLAPSSIGGTLDAVMALSFAGDPAIVQAPLDYLAEQAADVVAYAAADSGQAAKAVLALEFAGEESRNYGGADLVEFLQGYLTVSGQFGESGTFGQALAILALSAAGETVPEVAAIWLTQQQAANGSWDDGFGTADNADATAMAIRALLVAGGTDNEAAAARGREFLAQTQLENGTWEYGPGFGGNANSTALVIRALQWLGEDYVSEDSSWADGDLTPLEAILGYQSETGAFQSDFGEGPFDDFFATVQVLPALGAE